MLAIIEGFFIGVGFCFGIVACVIGLILLVKNMKNRPVQMYDEETLLKAFKKYEHKLRENEDYKNLPEVLYIIQKLEENVVVEQVFDYNIKKKFDIAIRGDDENQVLRFIDYYIISGKKTVINKK